VSEANVRFWPKADIVLPCYSIPLRTVLSVGATMRRRDFIKIAFGTAAGWPVSVLAQPSGRTLRIGALTGVADDSETKVRYAAFRQELQRLGWIDGQNVQIDARFGEGDAARVRKYAAELVCAVPRRYPRHGRSGDGASASSNPDHTDRVCTRARSSRLWHCRQPRGAGRQCYRFCAVRIQSKRQMAGTAQRNCA